MSPDFDARSPEVEALIANDGPLRPFSPSVTSTQMLRPVFISIECSQHCTGPNGKLRDELLDCEIFETLFEAKVLAEV